MNNKVQQNYITLAQNLGFSFDAESGAIYGERGGYCMIISSQNSNYPYMLSVTVSAQTSSGTLTKDICKQFKSNNKPVSNITQNGSLVTMSLKQYSDQTTLYENIDASINSFIDLLRTEEFKNACQTCGNQNPIPCNVGGNYLFLCSDCFSKLQSEKSMNYIENQNKSENLLAGIVGAFFGSLVGVIAIIILSQLGYVAVISGMIMAICTLKGYEKLAGKLTKKGIVVTSILMIIMTVVGVQLDWSIAVMREFEINFFDSFSAFMLLLKEVPMIKTEYYKSLVLQFIFVIIGAVPSMIATLKNKKIENRIYRLGSYTQNNEYDKI